MSLRGEPVPFTFVTEAGRFRGNVAPPPPEPVSRSAILRRARGTACVLAGLIGAAAGLAALDARHAGAVVGQQRAGDAAHH